MWQVALAQAITLVAVGSDIPVPALAAKLGEARTLMGPHQRDPVSPRDPAPHGTPRVEPY